MSKNFQRGISIILLVVLPLSIFFALGEARFYTVGLKKYYPTITENADGSSDTTYQTISSFSFLDQDSVPFSSESLDDKIYVTDFFFTACPTICIAMTENMKEAYKELEQYDDVMLLSFTVDPRRDMVETLARYGRKHNINSAKWKLLTGDQEEIYNLAYRDYKVNAVVDTSTGKVEFVHDNKFILVDKEGIIRGYYDGTNMDDVDRMITETRQLVKMYRLEKYENE